MFRNAVRLITWYRTPFGWVLSKVKKALQPLDHRTQEGWGREEGRDSWLFVGFGFFFLLLSSVFVCVSFFLFFPSLSPLPPTPPPPQRFMFKITLGLILVCFYSISFHISKIQANLWGEDVDHTNLFDCLGPRFRESFF